MMNLNTNYSPDSKVWIYQSSRPFTEEEISAINDQLAIFTKQWTAHNAQLQAQGNIIEDRLILLIVDETHTAASGCSIDTSVHFIKSLEKKFNVDLFDRTLVNFYRDGTLSSVHLQDLPELFAAHVINEETMVIDPLVNSKATFDTNFKTALGNSWMKNFLQ